MTSNCKEDAVKFIMRNFTGLGVQFEKQTIEDNNRVFYITVPEYSEFKDVNGIEMSGISLAKRFKSTIKAIGIKAIVKSKVRKNQTWTNLHKSLAENEFDCKFG